MIVVDFETTGLIKPGLDFSKQPGIVQIGLAEIDDDCKVHNWVNFLVNPEMEIEPEAANAHKVTNEMVGGERTFPEVWLALVNIFRDHRTWVGFNCEFDKRVLFYNLQRYGLEMRFPWPDQELDIMKIAKGCMNFEGKRGPKFPNLTELHVRLFNKPFEGAHDAMNDVNATVDCMREMKRLGLM